MDNPIVEVMATSMPYKMIVAYLTTLPTLRAFNSLYMKDYFIQFFSVFISDQNVNGKSKRNRNCIFSFPWDPKGHIFDYFFCA